MATTVASISIEEQYFIVQDKDGDYIESVESTNLDTVKRVFHWTRDRRRARVFAYSDLFARETVCLMQQIIQGHSGAHMIPIAENETM